MWEPTAGAPGSLEPKETMPRMQRPGCAQWQPCSCLPGTGCPQGDPSRAIVGAAMSTSEGELLAGGWQTRVRRIGDRVHRSPGPWSTTVIALLNHLGEAGFPASPRPVGSGFDEDGNEVLDFIEGESPQPHAWTDAAAHRIGELLAALHRATAGFEPPASPRWRDWYGRSLGDARIVGHGDLGPWNILARDGVPVGFIDWDYAGPVDPLYELAHVTWLNAQLHDDLLAEQLGLPDAAGRARQARSIVDGYGLARAERAGLVERMVEHAVHAGAHQALEHGVDHETTSGMAENGFPVLWGITWKVRSASWMLRNRNLLEAAL